jgi:lysophospholipase L1-like esterase
MSRKSVVFAVLAAITVAVTLAVTRPALSATVPVRIMPLGDSITGGPGCWRALLWDRLQRTGYTNIDFVGTLPGGGCSVPFDGDNEGHGGYQATGIANQNQLPGWLSATNPDIVLMHLGTNDVWNNVPTATIMAAFDKLLGQMRTNNPNVKILVAQIIPMTPNGCTWCPPGVSALNSAIPGWAASRTTAQSSITVVDQYTGFDTVADTNGDGVHPDDSGFQKISDRWYPALAPLLSGTTPTPSPSPSTTRAPSPSASPTRIPSPSASPTRAPSPSPSPTRAPSPSPSPSPSPTRAPSPSASPSSVPGGACAATYKVVNQWTGGFQGEVTVQNGTAAASSAWTATFTFANGQQITQVWNATTTSSGAAVTAKNLSWNGNLASAGTATFGFLASWNGTNAVPAVACSLN